MWSLSPSVASGESSGVDLLAGRFPAGDLHLARLGLLRDGDRQGQYPVVVGGAQVVGVEGVAEEQLSAEDAVGPFVDDPLRAVCQRRLAFGVHGEDVLLDGQVDR